MGARGPVPKRTDQRRRRNKPADGSTVTKAAAGRRAPAPPVDRNWHPAARRWYLSLKRSGQAEYYEPSDWTTAWLVAETMSRELQPQPMVVGSGDAARIEMVKLPPKGASLAAWFKAMGSLMVTEGDRRRLRLELERGKDAATEDPQQGAAVASMARWREKLADGG
ncbi:MAG: hypothetical protein JO222_09350 [Frankiales bacterium]|nr:hypothetical protein [Frankiales bacterium]